MKGQGMPTAAMAKISAKYRFFPLLCLGLTAFFAVKAFMEGEIGLATTEILIFVLVTGLLTFLKKIIPGTLVDEVYDCGDFLLIRHRGEEERVGFPNIMEMKSWTRMFPPVVTFQLMNPGKFGLIVSFTPSTPFTLSPYADYSSIENLIVRVNDAKSKRVL